jgi:hypothetical protein
MRSIFVFLFLTILTTTSFAQKITYDLPQNLETAINKDDYKTIVDMAIPIIEKRFVIDYVKNGAIELKKGQEIKTLNLDNLIVRCVSESDKSKWNDIIQAHFNALYATIDEQKKFDPNNFEAVKKYLSLRIYPKATVIQPGGPDNLLVRVDLEDTYTVLMLDLPGSFTAVQRAYFNFWKTDSAEVFKLAQTNINAHKIEKITKQFDIDGSSIEISFLGEDNYAASYALDLMNNSPELVGEWGSVLAIPNKGLVDLCKVSKTHPVDFVKFIQRTKALTDQSYQQAEQPISNKYFWYYKGKFTKINVAVDAKGNISVLAPQGLTELMTISK